MNEYQVFVESFKETICGAVELSKTSQKIPCLLFDVVGVLQPFPCTAEILLSHYGYWGEAGEI